MSYKEWKRWKEAHPDAEDPDAFLRRMRSLPKQRGLIRVDPWLSFWEIKANGRPVDRCERFGYTLSAYESPDFFAILGENDEGKRVILEFYTTLDKAADLLEKKKK